MIVDKMTKLLSCKRWTLFKRVDPLMIKPGYSLYSRNITNSSQLVKKLLYSKSPTCAYFIKRCMYAENQHAYNIMTNSTAYSNFLSPTLSVTEDLKIDSIENLLEAQWISMSNSEILENFKRLSHYAYYNHENLNHLKYKGICDIIVEKCTEFSNEELIYILDLLQFWRSNAIEIHDTSFWMALDKKFTDRLPSLSNEQIFLISDYIYKLNAIHVSNFIYHSMRKLEPKEMTPANLVQFAFLMKVKGPIVGIRLTQFEYCIEENIDKFNVEELSIICMSFFKYQTAIRSRKLLLKIIQKLQADIDNVSDISLASILKALRYSADLNILKAIDNLLKSLENQIEERNNVMTLTHIALAQTTLILENKNLLQKIREKFSKEIHNARLKDIERLTFTLSTFNYDPKTTPFYGIAVEELLSPRRRGEILKFPKPYVYTIMFMLRVNHFPEEIVKNIMAPDFVKAFCQNDMSNMDREYLEISYCLQIDHPEYNGPKLRKDQLRYLLKKYGVFEKETTEKFHKIDQAGKLMIDVAHNVKLTMGAESAIHLDYPLPYCNRQCICICYDPATKSFVPPAESLNKIPLGEIKYAPKDGKKWAVIVPASHNILTRNSFRPTGVFAMQIRHLERIGYKPIIVTFNEWNALQSRKNKFNFVSKTLNDLQSEMN